MADNVAITAGTGTTMAADEVIDGTLGTVKVAYGKIMDGTLDGTNKLTITAANAAKVDGSAVTQPVSGSLTTVSTVTNLSQLGGAAVAMNTGLRSAGTQRVTIATDDVVPAAQSGTWTVQPGNTANTTAWKVDGSAVTQPVSQATAANLKAQVAQVASISTSATLQSAVAVTGNGSTLSTDGMSSVAFTVSGTFVATVTFEGTEDGANYTSLSAIQLGTNTIAATATAPGVCEAPVAGLQNVRARVTWVSGTSVTVTAHAVPVNYNGKVVNANIVSSTALPAGSNVIGHVIADTGSTTAVTGTVAVTESGTWNVGSSTATGSAVPANAMYAGVNAQTALPTAATAGNLTGATSDKFGRLVVLSGAMRDIVGSQTTTISASTAETTVGTAVASTFLDLTAITVSNTSATAARVDFRDTTAGSVLFSIYVPAGDTRGISFTQPQPQTTVNTNWTAQSSASVTDLRVMLQFIKNK